MSDDGIALKVRTTARLVKWEGDVPDCMEIEDPTIHPACLEVIELADDHEPKVIYRRETHAAD